MERKNLNPLRIFIALSVLVLFVVSAAGGALADRLFVVKPLDYLVPRTSSPGAPVAMGEKQVVSEESVVIDVVKRSIPAVVTISIETPKRQVLQFSPFGGFDVGQQGGGQQDIATGFIVSSDGLIVTNKHVVDLQDVKYKAITKDGKEYEIKKIYRDPANDIALIKIDASNLPILDLGDSDNLNVGQLAVAIGTPLGQFRQSVTTGVISGLGRGIQAGGSPFEGYVERLDNIIQTDAAINPGNSGGPLLDSSGRVIGVNVAVAEGAQNIGFAIPINTLKDSIKQFHDTGDFSRPFLGIQYQIITKDAALANEVPQGAYVRDVIKGSSADLAGIKVGDIITKFAGEKIDNDKNSLANLVNKHKVGEKIDVEVYNDETKKSQTLQITLQEAK
jgi:serine protease Do